jgi:hypothetical protein
MQNVCTKGFISVFSFYFIFPFRTFLDGKSMYKILYPTLSNFITVFDKNDKNEFFSRLAEINIRIIEKHIIFTNTDECLGFNAHIHIRLISVVQHFLSAVHTRNVYITRSIIVRYVKIFTMDSPLWLTNHRNFKYDSMFLRLAPTTCACVYVYSIRMARRIVKKH